MPFLWKVPPPCSPNGIEITQQGSMAQPMNSHLTFSLRHFLGGPEGKGGDGVASNSGMSSSPSAGSGGSSCLMSVSTMEAATSAAPG